jgi:adenosine deaminase
VHVDGSLRFDTFVELSRLQGHALPGGSREAARALLTGGGKGDLTEYIALFDLTLAVLQDADSLRRVAREIVEDCAEENVWHVELRFSPPLHRDGGLSDEQATDAVLAGIDEGKKSSGISAGLILAGVRHRPVEEAVTLADLAVSYKGRGVIGFDLAGVEPDNPAKRFTQAFHHILNNNINCTVHAGEAWGPESIHQALHYLNAHRISHATRLPEDRELANYVSDHRIPVEVGLSSSLRTLSSNGLQVHPLRRFLRRGIRVALTTNNRMLLDTTLTRELRLAVDLFDLNLLETENLLLGGFKSSFLHQGERKALIRRAVAGFTEARRKHGLEVAE